MTVSSSLTTIAPAKIILTGEHSVVYGMPAIVTAVNRFAYAQIAPKASAGVSLTLADFKQRVSSTMDTLRQLKERLIDSYRLCLNGTLQIRQVLQRPAELFQFTMISLLDAFQMQLQKGFHLKIHSEIPIGCGMGSSAATIVSVIQALAHFLKLDIKPEWLYKLSIEAERLQHGFSSGIDSYISLHGGCARFQDGKAQAIGLPPFSFYLINTGQPASSTGECVMHVAKHFKTSSIWQEFGEIAALIEEALSQTTISCLQPLMQFNHRLLVQLGVVPQKVQAFISDLEQNGLAAKICGAGSIYGEGGGVVLALAQEPPLALCRQYGYELMQAEPEPRGARLAI